MSGSCSAAERAKCGRICAGQSRSAAQRRLSEHRLANFDRFGYFILGCRCARLGGLHTDAREAESITARGSIGGGEEVEHLVPTNGRLGRPELRAVRVLELVRLFEILRVHADHAAPLAVLIDDVVAHLEAEGLRAETTRTA